MQGYQIHATALGGCAHLWHSCTTACTPRTKWLVDGGSSAVPALPGHARCHLPYPPSHRRRR